MLHASVSKTEGLEKSGRDSTRALVMAAFRFANVEAETSCQQKLNLLKEKL